MRQKDRIDLLIEHLGSDIDLKSITSDIDVPLGETKDRPPLAMHEVLVRARVSFVASFARGVTNDEAAVRAAITSRLSNGQTEGQITRLKLVRHQKYGRGKIDMLG